jgi:hypothetical protein
MHSTAVSKFDGTVGTGGSRFQSQIGQQPSDRPAELSLSGCRGRSDGLSPIQHAMWYVGSLEIMYPQLPTKVTDGILSHPKTYPGMPGFSEWHPWLGPEGRPPDHTRINERYIPIRV